MSEQHDVEPAGPAPVSTQQDKGHYILHQPHSRRFRCACGRQYDGWPAPAPGERKSRVRCDQCFRLHVRGLERGDANKQNVERGMRQLDTVLTSWRKHFG